MNEWEWNLLEAKTPLETLYIGGSEVKAGDRVRLRPGKRADIFDMALAGKTAVIESIEQDYEGKFHICVVADDDPGRDIGMMRQPGHRFFFFPEEVEPLTPEEAAAAQKSKNPAILVAGIGNIFLGDDGFGVEVATRLAEKQFPEGVRIIDFGIRGLDLAYALMDEPETTILIDACPRDAAPGTLYVMEPDLSVFDASGNAAVDAHAMNPLSVLRMAKSMGAPLKRILLLGCEPETLGPEEGLMGLSEPVEQAVGEAVKLTESLVARIVAGEWPLRVDAVDESIT
ncbi:MAG TPA: hydrogenase maturation protease [Candidatus Acidoferrum sp.]